MNLQMAELLYTEDLMVKLSQKNIMTKQMTNGF